MQVSCPGHGLCHLPETYNMHSVSMAYDQAIALLSHSAAFPHSHLRPTISQSPEAPPANTQGGPSPQLSPRGPPPPTKRATKPESVRASTTSRPATAKAGVRASAAAAAPSAGAAAAGGDNADDEGSLSSALMTKHEARERLVGLLGEECVVALEDAAWKARLEGMDVVLAKANEADVAAEHCSVLVQAMQHIPGWEEKNFQVRVAYITEATICTC